MKLGLFGMNGALSSALCFCLSNYLLGTLVHFTWAGDHIAPHLSELRVSLDPRGQFIYSAVLQYLLLQTGTRKLKFPNRTLMSFQRAALRATFQSVIVLAVATLFLKVDFSRAELATSLALSLLINCAWNSTSWKLLEVGWKKGRGLTPVFVITQSKNAEALARFGASINRLGFEVVGTLGLKEIKSQLSGPVDLSAAGPFQVHPEVSTIFLLASGPDSGVTAQRLSWALEGMHVDLVVVQDPVAALGKVVGYGFVGDYSAYQLGIRRLTRSKAAAKRSFDVCLSLIAFILSMPLFLLIALAIKLDDGGPILFVQERIGRQGEPFKMLKFRTMSPGSEGLHNLLVVESGQSTKLFKLKNDPRITSVGRLLRSCSLDELPQLLNILVGHMSVVGPRPQVREEVEDYRNWESRRLKIKPGLTGPWQVSGRSDLDWDTSIQLDLDYVDTWSLTGDLRYIFKTFGAVASRRGAY